MRVAVFTLGHLGSFIEMMQALALSLCELGHDAFVVEDELALPTVEAYVGIICHRPFDPTSQLPQGALKVLFQVEEMWNRRERGVYDKSNGWDLVLELYEENCEIAQGTENVRHCPLGFSTAFGLPVDVLQEPLDTFFFGSLTAWRKELGNLVAGHFPRTIFADQVWGSQRDTWIAQAKVNLSLKAHPTWSYPHLRCLLVQCREKFLLVEHASGGYGPYRAGLHFDEFSTKAELREKLTWWIRRPEERYAFAKAALQDIQRNHTMTGFLQQASKGYFC